MSNIELFNQDNKVGDLVVIYLNSGKDISGEVVEIGDNYILLKKDDGKQMRLFENIIGAWESISSSETESSDIIEGVINNPDKANDSVTSLLDEDSIIVDPKTINSSDEPQTNGIKIQCKIDLSKLNDSRKSLEEENIEETILQSESKLVTTNEQSEVETPQEEDSTFFESKIQTCVQDLKELFKYAHIDLDKQIEVNTTVRVGSIYNDAFGVGINDEGDTLLIQEEGFVGNPEVLTIDGYKLFCRPQKGASPKLSYVSIAQMTYGELLKYFEQYIKDEWIVKAISIVKSLRMFNDCNIIDNQLRVIRRRLRSASGKVYQKSITNVYDLTPGEEARLESFIKEKIDTEDKRHPLQDSLSFPDLG